MWPRRPARARSGSTSICRGSCRRRSSRCDGLRRALRPARDARRRLGRGLACGDAHRRAGAGQRRGDRGRGPGAPGRRDRRPLPGGPLRHRGVVPRREGRRQPGRAAGAGDPGRPRQRGGRLRPLRRDEPGHRRQRRDAGRPAGARPHRRVAGRGGHALRGPRPCASADPDRRAHADAAGGADDLRAEGGRVVPGAREARAPSRACASSNWRPSSAAPSARWRPWASAGPRSCGCTPASSTCPSRWRRGTPTASS